MSLMTWVIAVGGPLLGIAAVVALVVAHEHGAALRRRRLPLLERVPRAPHTGCRAPTALLDDYLTDEREAGPAQRRERHTKLLLQASRSSTWVLEEFLEERETALVAYATTLRPAQPARPLPLPKRVPALRTAPRRIEERAARPTRLVPLTAQAEIAIG